MSFFLLAAILPEIVFFLSLTLCLHFGCALASMWRRRMCLWCCGVKGNGAAASVVHKTKTLAIAPIRIENSRKSLDPSTKTTENEKPAIFFGHIQVICHSDMITSFLVTNDKIESRSNIKRLASSWCWKYVVIHLDGFYLMITCNTRIVFHEISFSSILWIDLNKCRFGQKKRMKWKRLSVTTRPKYIHVHWNYLHEQYWSSIWKDLKEGLQQTHTNAY